MNREKKITVFGDSIGKGVFTDGGKIEVIKDNAVRLFEEWKGIEIDNRSGYGQSLKRLLDKGVIEKYIAGLDKSKRNTRISTGKRLRTLRMKIITRKPESKNFLSRTQNY